MRLITRRAYPLHFIILFFGLRAHAQIIQGTVVDSTNQPLHLVSVALLKDSNLITATVTNAHGYFELPASLENGKNYSVRLSLVSYSPLTVSFNFSDKRLPDTLMLSIIPKTLQQVSVTARRPLITLRPDRYVVNVENSVLANGLTALEVLQRSPGVWVDNSGNIRIKGTQTVTVMINDVIFRMSPEELADYLRALKSEDISRIEVIPTPPAEFEAEGSGGVVKIFLNKAKKSGWSGSAIAQYWQQQQKPYVSSGLTLNYQLRKLYLSAGCNYVKDLRTITERVNIVYPGHKTYHNSTRRSENIGRQQYRFTAAYDINPRQSISVQSLVSQTKFHMKFLSDETHVSDTTIFTSAQSVKQRMFWLTGITANYSIGLDTVGSSLRFILDYSSSIRSEKNYLSEIPAPPAQEVSLRNDAPTDTKIFTAQTDYYKVLGKNNTIKAGVKYGSIRRDNLLTTEELVSGNWYLDPAMSSHFMYTENLLMVYSVLERSIKQTVINAGVRAEETFSKGHVISTGQKFSMKYFGLFPSVFITHPVNEKNESSISVAYARRLTRPAMSDLNPARMVFSKYTALVGNPNLKPEYSNNFSFTYRFVKNHAVDLYLTSTQNSISLSVQPGINNSIDYYSANTGSTLRYGISYSGRFSPTNKWSVMNNLSGYRSAYRFSGKKYRQTSWSANTLQTYAFGKMGDADLLVEYRSPYVYTNLYTYGNVNIDIGYTKKILNGKLRTRLSCTDLLNTVREKELTDEGGTHFEFYRKRPSRTIRISLTYNFMSGKKVVDRKIDQSNADERSRGAN